MSDAKKMRTLSAELVAKSKGELVLPSAVMETIQTLAPEAVMTLEALMLTGKSDTVRLKAAMEILALGGYKRETTINIKADIEDMDNAGLDARLRDLLNLKPIAGTVIDIPASAITEVKA
jgi:hypothetical protein